MTSRAAQWGSWGKSVLLGALWAGDRYPCCTGTLTQRSTGTCSRPHSWRERPGLQPRCPPGKTGPPLGTGPGGPQSDPPAPLLTRRILGPPPYRRVPAKLVVPRAWDGTCTSPQVPAAPHICPARGQPSARGCNAPSIPFPRCFPSIRSGIRRSQGSLRPGLVWPVGDGRQRSQSGGWAEPFTPP